MQKFEVNGCAPRRPGKRFIYRQRYNAPGRSIHFQLTLEKAKTEIAPDNDDLT
jgi:hypothetical protein